MEFKNLKDILNNNLIPSDFKVRSRYFKNLRNNLRQLEKSIKSPDDFIMSDDMIEGSIVDLLLTEGEDAVRDKFFISTASVPTDKTKIFIDAVIKNSNQDLALITTELIVGTAREIGFGGANWKDATIEAKFAEYSDYVEETIKAGDKIIVDIATYQKCSDLSDLAKSHEVSSYLFNTGRQIYKPLLEFDLAPFIKSFLRDAAEINLPPDFKMPILSELDFIYINDEAKYIQVIDIKTYSSSLLSSYYKYMYFYQLSIYFLSLSENMKHNEEFVKEHNLEGYTVVGPMILALNKGYNDVPRLYQPTPKHLTTAAAGGTFNYSLKPVDGWIKLALDLIWHIVNDKYDYSREVYETGCIEFID